MDVEEEVIELRQEVEDLRHSFGPLARTEARNDELRALLVVLLGKVERLAAREVQDSQSLQSRQKEAATRQKDHTAPTAEHPSLAPYSPLSGKEAPPVFPTEAATRDMAQMRDRLAGERALVAELRLDLEAARAEARALLGGDIQGDLDVIRKEISAVQARVLRASLNGQI